MMVEITARALLGSAVIFCAACGGSAASSGGPDEPVSSEDSSEALPPTGGRPACELELALQCADGQTDGCLVTVPGGGPLTTHHVCVLEGATGGPPCEQEIGQVCQDGLTDACLHEPRFAAVHVCIVPP